MELPVQPLTAEAFAPFGQVIELPAQPTDADGPGWRWWAKSAVLDAAERPYTVGYLRLEPSAFTFDWAERHMHTQELLLPLGGDCLVYVGPADYPEEPERLAELERFQVFRVRDGQGVILNEGVWHGAPLAVEQPLAVAVLLQEDTGRVDTSVVRFTETPVGIKV